MMNSISNPYRWNEPTPDLFFGRHELAQQLFQQLSGEYGKPRACFAVVGGRRMGKTTLLKYLNRLCLAAQQRWLESGSRLIPIFFDCQSLAKPHHDTQIWNLLLRQILVQLPVAASDYTSIHSYEEFAARIKAVIPKIPERLRIIILFDEVERIIALTDSSFLENARSWLSTDEQLANIFTAVFAGSNHIQLLKKEGTSPLANILTWRSLSSFQDSDAYKLMQEPIQIVWPTIFLERIFTETGGHPMLIQYLMQQVCMQYTNDQDIMMARIDPIINQFEDDQSGLFESWWLNHCTPVGQKIYAHLSKYPKEWKRRYFHDFFDKKDVDHAVESLFHLGIIKKTSYHHIIYNGDMFLRWYKKDITIDDEQYLLENLDIYTPLEYGLLRLKSLLSDHSRITQLIPLEEKLVNNIALARNYGDTNEWKTERSIIISSLDAFTFQMFKITFKDIYKINS